MNTTLFIVGLGFFIDTFDLFLYNSVRSSSLLDLGLQSDALTKAGIWILNFQVVGMFLGGLVWGVLGDRVGRKKALLGSILCYSIGSIGCAFVQHIWLYAGLRFIAGIGLAGETGLGAILVAETLSNHKRDWGLAVYSIFCYLGILAAGLIAGYLSWRLCYALGGIAGLLLLLARMALLESGLFEKLTITKIRRGSLKLLLTNRNLLKRYLCSVFLMMPYFYVVNVLITLAPEFGKAMEATDPIKGNIAIAVYSSCAAFGVIITTLISRMLHRRILTIGIFMGLNIVLLVYYLSQHQPSSEDFYSICGIMGLTNFFVLFLSLAIEQFGTNMRATAGASALSSGRATLVITNSIFLAFRTFGFDIISAAAWVSGIVFIVGFICLSGLRETYRKEIDFVEI